MGRWSEPREIGAVAAYPASEASSFMTGRVVVLDRVKTLWRGTKAAAKMGGRDADKEKPAG